MSRLRPFVKSFFAVLSVVAALPAPAVAYVREVTASGVPVAWKHPCISMHIFVGAAPPLLTSADYAAAAVQAAAVWSYPQLACTDIRLAMTPEEAPAAEVGNDGQNVIVFRQGTWCREPTPVNDAGVAEPACYPSSALAVTTVVKNSKTGEILDTDIEFNAVNYSWGDFEAQPDLADGRTADFQNALTHELGHVIGLDHNCYAPADGQPRRADNNGVPEVNCYGNPSLPDAVANATMYPSVQLSDTLRRALSPDDSQGVCDIYPSGSDFCSADVEGGGCTVEPPLRSRDAGAVLVLGLALGIAGVLVWRRRRV
jgi:hypothetical protein